MRCSNRNKQPFWYALQSGTATGTDEYGNQCSTYATYGKPVKAYGNISPAKGKVVERQYGDDDVYDKTIVLEDRRTPIDEYAVLWIDETPVLNADGTLATDKTTGMMLTPWNYIVRKVGRGLPTFGGCTLAVSKVSVS